MARRTSRHGHRCDARRRGHVLGCWLALDIGFGPGEAGDEDADHERLGYGDSPVAVAETVQVTVLAEPSSAARTRGAGICPTACWGSPASRSSPIAVHGSATLGKSLADAGLVDRYHLLVFPVLLGAGKRLFSDADKDKSMLKLVEFEAYANGVQKQVFDVVR
nr:dihydrofolate reductase family protein [Pseudofrankia sp. DC12]